tara:strand:- start:324 stop:956 length:633 start_codon:yes stop_codon:yes gene_type:complete
MMKFNENGLMTAVIQDVTTNRVLMVGYMNKKALSLTIKGPDVWFYSRSKKQLWHKGETSGHFFKVMDIERDCDFDAVLVKVDPIGPACHTNNISCFDSGTVSLGDIEESELFFGPSILIELSKIIKDRAKNLPLDSYTAKLVKLGKGAISQKIIEEAGEVAVALMGDKHSDLSEEVADLLYHVLVGLEISDTTLEKTWEILNKRNRETSS